MLKGVPAMELAKKQSEKCDISKLSYGIRPGVEKTELEEDDRHNSLISVSELAKLARVSRSALIFYDNIGLVAPAERGDNSYRYYSPHQVTSTNLINTLQELDIPLKKITELIKHRTPESIVSLFSEQDKHISQRVEKLHRSQKLLLTLKNIIEECLSVDEEKIETCWREEEDILLGPQVDYSGGLTIEEAFLNFFKHWSAADKDLDLNYPVYGFFSEERIKRGDWFGPDKFYFKMPGSPDKKPAGLYVIGYSRGYYGHSDTLYKRLLAYIEENALEISGPAFEEYPFNEISITDPHTYLIRASIMVKK